jgi:glucose/arabinose dehydrogenase
MSLAPSRLESRHALLSLIALTLAPSIAGAQTFTDPNLMITQLTTPGLAQPTTMAFLGPDDFLVLEKNTGRVRRVTAGVMQGPDVLDVPVSNNSERGMLGIAIQQGSPIRVYLYYTESTTDGGAPIANRVYRYDWNPGGTGSLVSPQLVLDLPVTPGPNHDGGILVLDGTNRLHVLIGELNRNGQLQNFENGPAPDDTGVIFRVNSDGSAAAGNPFSPYCSVTTTTMCQTTANCPGGETCRTQVARYIAYGVRNSFGMSFDPMTGTLWDSENGENVMDEINVVTPGFNSGWEDCMGPSALDGDCVVPGGLFNMPGGGSSYSEPEFSWQNTIAPTAIFFPVGTTWGPNYTNVVLVGDNNFGQIYSFPLNGSRTALDTTQLPPALQDLVANNSAERDLVRIGQGWGAITDMKIGPDNDVYIVDIALSRIFRVHGPVPVELQSFGVE